jgi:hypothetical protein
MTTSISSTKFVKVNQIASNICPRYLYQQNNIEEGVHDKGVCYFSFGPLTVMSP